MQSPTRLTYTYFQYAFACRVKQKKTRNKRISYYTWRFSLFRVTTFIINMPGFIGVDALSRPVAFVFFLSRNCISFRAAKLANLILIRHSADCHSVCLCVCVLHSRRDQLNERREDSWDLGPRTRQHRRPSARWFNYWNVNFISSPFATEKKQNTTLRWRRK